jgi:preprotein translocase subunit SecF
VTATYPGADSKTLADSVASPIEQQINGVDNMLYMSSISSSTGQLTMTVYFSLDTDPDIAQVQVQNRVNLAMPQLPSAVTQQGVNVQKKSSSIMMLVAVFAKNDRYSANYIANYANVYVLDALKRVKGRGPGADHGRAEPGDADLDESRTGWPRSASRRRTSPTRSASRTSSSAPGQVGQQPNAGKVELTFRSSPSRSSPSPSNTENIICARRRTAARSFASATSRAPRIGLQQYIVDSKLNGVPATVIAVYQQPGANGLTVSKLVRETMEQMKASFPDGMDYMISLDTNDFVRLSIKEVIKTLFEAIVLVVLVVYLFLQSFRTTIICTVAICVALIATFTGMLALGFSINLLTLFGLVLAIGMVVDDAIVVVENVERNMAQHHLEPREATIRSMEEIASSLVAVVLVMCSVFVPAAFLPGTTGQLYKQFAITIVISVSVSGFIRPHADARDVRGAPQAQSAVAARILRLVQPAGGSADAGLRCGRRPHDQADGDSAGPAGRIPVRDLAPVPRHSNELRAQRGPGLRDGRHHHAAGGESLAHTGHHQQGRRDLQGTAGSGDPHRHHRLQPARQRVQDQRRRHFRHLRRFRASGTRASTRAKKENARAILQGILRGGAHDRGRDRDPDRAAGNSGHRQPPAASNSGIQDTGHGRPRGSRTA